VEFGFYGIGGVMGDWFDDWFANMDFGGMDNSNFDTTTAGRGVGDTISGNDWSMLNGADTWNSTNNNIGNDTSWFDQGGVSSGTTESGNPNMWGYSPSYDGLVSGPMDSGVVDPYNVSEPGYSMTTPSMGETTPSTPTPTNSITDYLSKLKDNKQLLPLGAGLLANYFGKSMSADTQQAQTKQNLADYLSNVTWTPEKSGNYVNAVRSNAAGTTGAAASKAKGTLAEQLASNGRGGGSYGSKAGMIDRAGLNQMADATNKAITTVNTPSNLSAAPFMAQQGYNAVGDTLTGLGGTLANYANNQQTMEILKQLFARS
jgi:hypothetical protein